MDRKIDGHYDYDGACDPKHLCFSSYETFSVSVFRWVSKAGGKGLKKTKSVYRIHGIVSNPASVYRRAEEICNFLDGGGILNKKSERVK